MYSADCVKPAFDVSRETYVECATGWQRFQICLAGVLVSIFALIFILGGVYWAAIAIPIIWGIVIWNWIAAPIRHGAHWDNVDILIKGIMRDEKLDRAAATQKYREDVLKRGASIAFAQGMSNAIGSGFRPNQRRNQRGLISL